MSHLIEADFTSELGHRVLVLTCVERGVSGVADDLGRCTYCNQTAAVKATVIGTYKTKKSAERHASMHGRGFEEQNWRVIAADGLYKVVRKYYPSDDRVSTFTVIEVQA